MNASAPKGAGLERLREIWSRRKWLATVAFAWTLAAAATGAASLPELYRATVTILVERPSEAPGAIETQIHTIEQEVMSRSRLLQLRAGFRLYPGLRDEDEALDRMRDDILVEATAPQTPVGRGATVALKLGYRTGDPGTAALVANALASLYVEQDAQIRGRRTGGAAERLKTRVDELRAHLEDQERRLGDVVRPRLTDSPEASLATLDRLNAQLRATSEQRIRAMERREDLLKRLADVDPAASGGDPDVVAARIAQLHRELADLRRRFSDKYPDVIRVRAEIAALERQTAEGRREPKGDVAAGRTLGRQREAMREVEGDIKSLHDEEAALRGEIASLRDRLGVASHPRPASEALREYHATRDLYVALAKRYEEARIVEGAEAGSPAALRILEPAVAPADPVAPNRPRLLLAALVLSLLAAAGAVLLAEQIDATFHTLDDLRSFTRVPVLVSIPDIVTPSDTRRRRGWFGLAAAGALAGLALIAIVSHRVADGNEALVTLLSRGRT